MSVTEHYEALKAEVIVRKEPFDRFIKFLESKTTWLASPASTRYHMAEEQGLLKHSVGVTETLLRFWEFLAPAIPRESCAIVGLFYDVGKLRMPDKPLYLPNDNEWLAQNKGIRYKINPDVVAMGLAVMFCFNKPVANMMAQWKQGAVIYESNHSSYRYSSDLHRWYCQG